MAPISIEIGKMLLRGGAHTPKQSLSSKVMGGLFLRTLESGINVGQGIIVGPGKFVKKNKHRSLNKCRA